MKFKQITITESIEEISNEVLVESENIKTSIAMISKFADVLSVESKTSKSIKKDLIKLVNKYSASIIKDLTKPNSFFK